MRVSALSQYAALEANVLPQPAVRRNGETASFYWRRYIRLLSGLLIVVVSLTSGHELMAAPVKGLDWHFDPKRDFRMVRTTPDSSEVNRLALHWMQPNPVVLPQPEWPEQKKKDNRGLQLIDPSVGVAGVQNADETRTAVQIAENQQSDRLTQNAAPVPGQEELPGPLANIGLEITMGVQYIF